ncbi:hypothetical protein PCE1_005002 [Barthelona sp. PCE]
MKPSVNFVGGEQDILFEVRAKTKELFLNAQMFSLELIPAEMDISSLQKCMYRSLNHLYAQKKGPNISYYVFDHSTKSFIIDREVTLNRRLAGTDVHFIGHKYIMYKVDSGVEMLDVDSHQVIGEYPRYNIVNCIYTHDNILIAHKTQGIKNSVYAFDLANLVFNDLNISIKKPYWKTCGVLNGELQILISHKYFFLVNERRNIMEATFRNQLNQIVASTLDTDNKLIMYGQPTIAVIEEKERTSITFPSTWKYFTPGSVTHIAAGQGIYTMLPVEENWKNAPVLSKCCLHPCNIGISFVLGKEGCRWVTLDTAPWLAIDIVGNRVALVEDNWDLRWVTPNSFSAVRNSTNSLTVCNGEVTTSSIGPSDSFIWASENLTISSSYDPVDALIVNGSVAVEGCIENQHVSDSMITIVFENNIIATISANTGNVELHNMRATYEVAVANPYRQEMIAVETSNDQCAIVYSNDNSSIPLTVKGVRNTVWLNECCLFDLDARCLHVFENDLSKTVEVDIELLHLSHCEKNRAVFVDLTVNNFQLSIVELTLDDANSVSLETSHIDIRRFLRDAEYVIVGEGNEFDH